MSVTVRFAPSPTGHIHIGNVRPALFNYLFAKKQGGNFVLRYDDTDVQRSKEEYAVGIAEDLKWLGINLIASKNSPSALHCMMQLLPS